MEIRAERVEDAAEVRQVNEAAFGGELEANIVNALRARTDIDLISLVAEADGRLIGHILFSPVTITDGETVREASALGPLAVLPAFQRQGVGTALTEAGLAACAAAGHDIVLVLGHASYYPRFGFVPSRPHGIRWENDVAEDVFMVRELRAGSLAGYRGVVRYLPEFG